MIENNHETAPISSGTIAIQQLAIVQPKLDRSIALRRWVRIYFSPGETWPIDDL